MIEFLALSTGAIGRRFCMSCQGLQASLQTLTEAWLMGFAAVETERLRQIACRPDALISQAGYDLRVVAVSCGRGLNPNGQHRLIVTQLSFACRFQDYTLQSSCLIIDEDLVEYIDNIESKL